MVWIQLCCQQIKDNTYQKCMFLKHDSYKFLQNITNVEKKKNKKTTQNKQT